MSIPSPTEEHESDIATLKRRLEEADEIVAAITRGTIDAVLVGPDDDRKRVLMLSGAYGRYRQIVEGMRQGAVTVTPEGEIIFVNRSFAATLRLTPNELFRAQLQQFILIEDRPAVALVCAASSRRVHRVSMIRPDGAKIPTAMSVVVANDGFTTILVTPLRGSDAAVDAPAEVPKDLKESWTQLVDRIAQPALAAAPDGRVLHANDLLTALVETIPNGVDGMALGDLFVYEAREEIAHALVSGHHGGADSKVGLRRDSAEVPVAVTVTAVGDVRICLFTER
jgi:PAS domain S-box-containing protein